MWEDVVTRMPVSSCNNQNIISGELTEYSHLSQRDADGPRPTAHIQYCAVLIQLGPFPHSRVQHLCSSCIHLPGNTDTLNTGTVCVWRLSSCVTKAETTAGPIMYMCVVQYNTIQYMTPKIKKHTGRGCSFTGVRVDSEWLNKIVWISWKNSTWFWKSLSYIFLTWKKEWGDILNFRPRSSSWMHPSPATSSQGKSSMLGEVLWSRKYKFSAAFRHF